MDEADYKPGDRDDEGKEAEVALSVDREVCVVAHDDWHVHHAGVEGCDEDHEPRGADVQNLGLLLLQHLHLRWFRRAQLR